MKDSILLGLTQNIAILLAFSLLHDYFWSRNDKKKGLLFKIGSGLVLGTIGIVLILTPWHFVPGIIFDTRSVLLVISGLFFGTVPTVLAMLIIGFYRFSMGDMGAIMGIAVVISSGSIGLMWGYFRPRWKKNKPIKELALSGFLVHLVMLMCIVFLPAKVQMETLKEMALPVLLIYPAATMLLGSLMLNQNKNWETRKALKISEERWHFAIEGAGDGIWDWNPSTNKIFFSKQWKLMLGFEDHELENKYEEWDKRVFAEDKAMVLEILNRHIKGETPEYISEYRMICKNGSYKWILDRGKVMVRDADGKPLRFIGTHTDISERKEARERIRKLNEELEKNVAERTIELKNRTQELTDNQKALLNLIEDLNEKSEELTLKTEQLQITNKELEAFSYSVSHDLRAPLRAVNGFVQILKEEYSEKLDAEGNRLCSIIESNALKMGQLIDDLLAFSRLIRSEIRESSIDMKNIVNQSITELSHDFKDKKIKFSVGEILPAVGDISMIRQVWINLISNALKYSSQKEEINITIGSEKKENEIIYFIRDNGIGFDMQYIHKLFRVFQRLHNMKEYEGTGVGLAIVQRIINRHQGRVWAEGEVDKGATFYFTLHEVKISGAEV